MTSDAVSWSSESRRLHPIAFLFRIGRIGRQFALPGLVALLTGGDRGQILLAAAAVAWLVASMASWWRFTYTFDGLAFSIDEGIFKRRHRTVPMDRIQQLDVEAKLVHRLLGVVALRIDTGAGSSGAEVNLGAVSREEAERLRRALLRRDPATEPAAPAATAAVPAEEKEDAVVRLRPGLLAMGGITGPEQLVMLGILLSLAQVAEDLPDTWLESVDPPIIPTGPLVVVLAIVALVGTWFALAAAAAVVKYYDFTLTCDDAVHIRRGLLDKREASLARRRLQAVAIQQTFLRRALHLLSLRITSGGSQSGMTNDVSRLVVPVLQAADLERVLGEILPLAAPLPPLVPAPPAALRRAIVRLLAPAVLGALLCTVLLRGPWGAVSLAAVPLAVLLGYARYRGLAHGASDAVVVSRHGALQRETVVADKAKVQLCAIESTPFQRRAGLSNLRIVLAGNQSTTIRDGDGRLMDELLADIASTRRARRDEAGVRREVSERR